MLEPLSNQWDTSSLREFGEITVMFKTGLHVSCPSIYQTETYVESVQGWLRENGFDPRNDAFVLAGRSTKLAVAVAALTRMFPRDAVTVLMYDGNKQVYVERTL